MFSSASIGNFFSSAASKIKNVIEEEQKSIELEISSFLDALKGTDDRIGNPRAALIDVAVIQAALTSEGVPIDLDKLVKSG